MARHTPYHQGRKRTTVELISYAIARQIRGLSGMLGTAAQNVGTAREADINQEVGEATGRRKKR